MSYARALQTIHLQPTDRVAHQETLDHPEFMRELVDFDPWDRPLEAFVGSYKALDVDWIFGLPKHTRRFARGESSRRGENGVRYTEWGLTGSGWREEYPFHTVEDVLAYDPETAIPPPEQEGLLAGVRSDQELMGDAAMVTGLHYTTLFQFPIMTFGWELFLTAAASEPARFQRVLQGFAAVTRRALELWAAEEPDLVMLHDDIAVEQRPVFHPDWYRQRLFPLYEYLLEPFKQRRKTRLAFVSDGNYALLLDDLVALGFDGFLINANMDLGAIARRLGQDHFLVGNVNTTVLTLGTPQDVVREVERCLEQAKPCAGHFIKATGDLPHNIPLENIRTYFEAAADLSSKVR